MPSRSASFRGYNGIYSAIAAMEHSSQLVAIQSLRQYTHGLEKPSSLPVQTQQVPLKGELPEACGAVPALGPHSILSHADLFPGSQPPSPVLNRATLSLPSGKASSLLQQLAQRVCLGKLINSCMLGSCPGVWREG